jgi:hypothetical protein
MAAPRLVAASKLRSLALVLKAGGDDERASAVWQRALRLLRATTLCTTDATAASPACSLDLDDAATQVRLVKRLVARCGQGLVYD